MKGIEELKLKATEEATQAWRAKFQGLFQSVEAEDRLRQTCAEMITGLIDLAKQRLQKVKQEQIRATESPEYQEEIFGKFGPSVQFTRTNLKNMLDRAHRIGIAELSSAVEQSVHSCLAWLLTIVFREHRIVIRKQLEASLTFAGVSDETASELILQCLGDHI